MPLTTRSTDTRLAEENFFLRKRSNSIYTRQFHAHAPFRI